MRITTQVLEFIACWILDQRPPNLKSHTNTKHHRKNRNHGRYWLQGGGYWHEDYNDYKQQQGGPRPLFSCACLNPHYSVSLCCFFIIHTVLIIVVRCWHSATYHLYLNLKLCLPMKLRPTQLCMLSLCTPDIIHPQNSILIDIIQN